MRKIRSGLTVLVAYVGLLWAGLALVCGSFPQSAMAGNLFLETFDTDTGDVGATYPAFSANVPAFVTVSGGVVRIMSGGNITFLVNGFAGDLLIEADIGTLDGTPGTFNVGLLIGTNILVFHPGLDMPGVPGNEQGAFRVEGPGGIGNTPMGFTPAGPGVLHHFEVVVTAATGQFDIKVTDANNPANVFTTAFTNTGYTPGSDKIGFRINGIGQSGLYDNLSVSTVPADVLIDGAIKFIDDLVLDPSTTDTLVQKLQEAKEKFELGDLHDARDKVCTFVAELESAVDASSLTTVNANILLKQAGTILGEIEFP